MILLNFNFKDMLRISNSYQSSSGLFSIRSDPLKSFYSIFLRISSQPGKLKEIHSKSLRVGQPEGLTVADEMISSDESSNELLIGTSTI